MRRVLLAVVLGGVAAGCGGGSAGPAVLEFVGVEPAQPRIGDVVTVRFRAIDSRGNPLAGQRVDFSLTADRPNVTLNTLSGVTVRGTGVAETQLQAQTRVTSVVVRATAGDKTVDSLPITFAGTQPSARQFTFQCGPTSGNASGGRHAISAYGPARNLIAGVKLNCSAHLGDRNGDGVAGVLVSFLVEAGTIGPTALAQTDVVGNATVLYKTSDPLPKDVAPGTFRWNPPSGMATQTGVLLAPEWMQPFQWKNDRPFDCSPNAVPPCTPDGTEPFRDDPVRRRSDNNMAIVNNPRDNLVSMIAVTQGEEAFFDDNNNGTFDSGEPYVDLTEPFVDDDDSGTWEAGERYIDTNGNGRWDGKNGTWDSNTLIWAPNRILWTGLPFRAPGAQSDAAMPKPTVILSPSTVSMRCPSTACAVCPKTPNAPVTLTIGDPWYNAPAINSRDDGCRAQPSASSAVGGYEAETNFGEFRYVSPTADIQTVFIEDLRDPNATPPVAKRSPTCGGAFVPFTLRIDCAYTASPIEGAKAGVSFVVTGDIE